MREKELLINKMPLGEKAAQIIRERIITGEYDLGIRLIEDELAKEFIISRASLRNAFLMLEAEGMVIRERNKHTRVIDFDKKKIADLFSFRRSVESLCMETCIKKAKIPYKEALEINKEIEELRSEKSIDSMKFVETDLAFHEAIVVASENTYAINVWNSVKYQVLTLLHWVYRNHKTEFANIGVGNHKNILLLMGQGDIKEANKMLQKHIESNLDFIINKVN